MRFVHALLGLFLGLAAAPPAARAQAPAAIGPGPVVVHTALGGFILGYDIDPGGTEGILSEALTRADGRHDVAVETFDLATGKILKILRMETDSRNGFGTLGVYDHVGLTEFEHVKRLFVDRRAWAVTAPLDANRLTGRWTPPFADAEDIITSGSAALGGHRALFAGFRNAPDDFHTYVFTSDVAANTFGPVLRIDDPVFDENNSPVVALWDDGNEAVLASSLGCFNCPTSIGRLDLATGTLDSFTGLGKGFVNGIAVDSTTGIACTTTEDDFSVEFYDFVQGTRRLVVLPGAFSQQQSGGAVAVDPIHRLFLVGQEFSSTALHGSSIQVFDEQGNFVESLDGLRLPASPAAMVIDPAKRAGYVIVTPDLTSLQSFTY